MEGRINKKKSQEIREGGKREIMMKNLSSKKFVEINTKTIKGGGVE